MNLKQIVEASSGSQLFGAGGVILLILLTLVQVSPIKIDPWTWIGKKFRKGVKALGSLFNGELIETMQEFKTELSEVKKDVSELKENYQGLEHLKDDVSGIKDKLAEADEKMCAISNTVDEQAAISARARILRFGDEVLHKRQHTKDHFDSILRDAKNYGDYCDAHPNFENGVTGPTIDRIKAVYAIRLENNDFL